MTNTTTNQDRRRGNMQTLGGVKAALITGSLIASLIGARLIAIKDNLQGQFTESAPAGIVQQQTQPQQQANPVRVAPQPMPQQPVTRSRSSG